MRARRRRVEMKRTGRTGGGRTVAVTVLLLLLGGSVAVSLAANDRPRPDAPTTGEFRVNTYTPDDQSWPKVARADNGLSAVVWASWQQEGPGTDYAVVMQALGPTGAFIGSELIVDDNPTGDQGSNGALDVAVCVPGPPGNITIAVVWGDAASGGGFPYNVKLQLYNASAAGGAVKIGPDITVNTYLPGNQGSWMDLLSVAMDSRCKMGTIAWGALGESGAPPHDDPNGDVFAREFIPAPFSFFDTQEWRVNTNITDNQHDPEVTMNDLGQYAVCWMSSHTANPLDIMARRFYWGISDGSNPVDALDWNVSDLTVAASDYSPTCSMLNDGWTGYIWGYDDGGGDLDIMSQAFDASRATFWPQYVASDTTVGDQLEPSISSNGTDTWVWTWTSVGQDGPDAGVYGWMSAVFALKGDEFRVNVNTAGHQRYSDVSMDSSGYYNVVWATEASPQNVSARLFDNVPMVPEVGGFAASVAAAAPALFLSFPALAAARSARLGRRPG